MSKKIKGEEMKGAFKSKKRLRSFDLGKLIKRKRPISNSAVARKEASSETLKRKADIGT